MKELEILRKNLDFNDVSILGNGPSLQLIPKSWKGRGLLIGMNRIDQFVRDHNIVLDIYIMLSDNIENQNWGDLWLESLEHGVRTSQFSVVNEGVYSKISDELRVLKSDRIIVIRNLKEPKLYKRNSVVTPLSYFTKSGTTLNFAVQLCLYFGVRNIDFYGVDLGWKKSSKKRHIDLNHYHKSYMARIPSGFLENCRMNYIHDRLTFIFDRTGINVRNYSPKTIVKNYDVYSLEGGELISHKSSRRVDRLTHFLGAVYSEVIKDIKRLMVSIIR